MSILPKKYNFIFGILCTKCGWLYKHSSTHKTSIGFISYEAQCTKCKSNTNAIKFPLDYFDNKPTTLFLTKEEMVEILI